MPRTFLPTSDNALLAFASNFSGLLSLNYAAYGIEQTVATGYATTFNTYKTTLAASQAPQTRGNASVMAKNQAKQALVVSTRSIARTIGNNMNVTDAQRQALGLTIRKVKPTPVPTPTKRPSVDIASVSVRTVIVKIHDGPGDQRGKAAGAVGAKVYTFAGTSYPSDPTLWDYQGDATRTKFSITFPDSVAGGTQVWVCAAWYTRKGDTGPISVPTSTNLQGGGTNSASMKIAA